MNFVGSYRLLDTQFFTGEVFIVYCADLAMFILPWTIMIPINNSATKHNIESDLYTTALVLMIISLIETLVELAYTIFDFYYKKYKL